MKTILCIGSITTDVIVKTVDNLPPPGVLQAVDGIKTRVGGCAANASIVLSRLGAPSVLVAKLGCDSYGDFVEKTAQENGVDCSGLCHDSSVGTTVSVVCISSEGERSFLYYPGSTAAFRKEDLPKELLQKSDIVFISGAMLMPSFDGAPSAEVLKTAKELGKYTVMDTAWDFDDIWLPKVKDAIPYLDLFMPSIDEATKLTGETDPEKIADRLFNLGAKNVIIKLGKQGALICPQGGERKIIPTYSGIKPVDTTGAGDSFCAGFLYGLANGWDYYESARFANAVATHCIMAVGAYDGIKDIHQITEFIKHNTAEEGELI